MAFESFMSGPKKPGRKPYVLKLSPAETSVFDLIVEGAPEADIAEILEITVKTVRHHLASIRRKKSVSDEEWERFLTNERLHRIGGLPIGLP